jgi:putative N6-adenine-specific DNA methylase
MGYTGYVFTGNPGLSKKVSLKPKRGIPFFNSGIECRLFEYELYEGSKKIKKPR